MKIVKIKGINENQRGIREHHQKSPEIWKKSPGRLESSRFISIRPLRIFQKCHSETKNDFPESYFFLLEVKKSGTLWFRSRISSYPREHAMFAQPDLFFGKRSGRSVEETPENKIRFYENLWKSMKIFDNLWKSLKIYENLWKSMKIIENQWKSKKINENRWKRWKSEKTRKW